MSPSGTATAIGRTWRPSICWTTDFPVCSPRLLKGRRLKRPADLARFTLLRTNDEPWKPWFEAAGLDWPEPSRGPIFNDSSHMLQAAAEGQGIALARHSLLGNDVRNGVLLRLFDIVAPASRKFWLVYPPRMAGTAKLTLFRRWLHDEIAADRDAAPQALPRRGRGRAPVAGRAGARRVHAPSSRRRTPRFRRIPFVLPNSNNTANPNGLLDGTPSG